MATACDGISPKQISGRLIVGGQKAIRHVRGVVR
jgi:hypothetical protein